MKTYKIVLIILAVVIGLSLLITFNMSSKENSSIKK
jgi:hypothetical protein